MDRDKYIDIATLYSHFVECGSVSTDSRSVREGDLFVALTGPSFDGNDYALAALSQGAAYAVVSRQALAEENERCLLVPDTLCALQELARHHRRTRDIPVIAITGTNGKTTTKELCTAVLHRGYCVLATEGNLNNHIGVPLTLLRLRHEHQIAIIEMGASAAGEIALLASIAEPTIGLVTNVGRAHLEGFGSIEGVLRAKGELPEYLRSTGGRYVLNDDDQRLSECWRDHHAIAYRVCDECDVVAAGLGADAQPPMVLGSIVGDRPYLQMRCYCPDGAVLNISTQLTGRYNASNVLAALTIGYLFGLQPQVIADGIASYHPTNNRSQTMTIGHGVHLIMDAYNANPSSMAAALDNLSTSPESYKYAILGDMKELGTATEEEHQHLIDWLSLHPEITPILCGPTFVHLAPTHWHAWGSVEELISWMTQWSMEAESVVLLKGSRGMALERCLPALTEAAQRSL